MARILSLSPPPPQDRHKIPKMRPTPKIQRLVNAELRNKVEALPNPTASSGIQPFAFPKNQLRADLLKRCIFRHQPVAQCIKRGAMQGVCIETGVGCISQRGVLEGFPGRGASRNYVDEPILHALYLILCAHMRLLTFPTKRFVEGLPLPQFSPSSGRNYVVASQDSIAATIAFCVVHPAHRRDCKA